MKKIGLLGFGTVGSGVYEIINEKQDMIKKATGENIKVEKILVRNIEKYNNTEIDPNLFTTDPNDILDNSDIDIVVEVLGGIEIPYEYITKALKSGKDVVSANKAVIAPNIEYFHKLAEENKCGLLYEASVAGGIPIVKNLKEMLKYNEVNIMKGILNGTTNFILSKMYDEDLSFESALDLAHKYGYAEADPTDDIEGFDAGRKIAILSSLTYNTNATLEDVDCFGITSIRTLDIVEFKKMGLSPKLLGCAIRKDNLYSASVEPVLVDSNSVFASVKDAFNIVSITGDKVGELQFFGQGAGKNPTGNAVVMDIIDIVTKNYKEYSFSVNKSISSSKENLFEGFYYLRISLDNEDSREIIAEKLRTCNVNLKLKELERDIIVITESVSSSVLKSNIIEKLDLTQSNYCYLRVESDNLNSLEDFKI